MKYFILLFIFLGSLFTSAQPVGSTDSSRAVAVETPHGSWIIFKGDSLFKIFSNLGPYTVADRSEIIIEKLEKLYVEIEAVEDSFNIQEEATLSIIRYGEVQITSLTDGDVAGFESKRSEVAMIYANNIKQSFEKHIERRSATYWIKNIGMTLLFLLGLFLIFYLLNRIFKWIDLKLTNYEKGLKRKRKNLFRYLTPKGPEYFFPFLAKLVKWSLIIIILLLYLPLLFSYIPYTKGLVFEFYNYIANPVMFILTGLYNFLDNLFFILIIFIVARYIIRVTSYIGKEIESEKLVFKGFHKDWARPTINIFKIIIYAFALVFMFPYLPGSDSPAFQGVSIFLGVLFSLGSTSAIANIVAGIVITYMRPFSVGDRVKIGNTMGDIISKSLLVTKVRTIKNEDVTIPNATIINTHLWNFTSSAKEIGIILHTSVTIGYDVPWDTVNKLLLEAAKNTENLTRDPKPFVLQKSLNDFYVEYELNVYTKQPSKMAMFYSELHRNILKAFNDGGVEILSPHYNAIRDGNDSTIHDPPDTRNPVEKIIDKASGKKSNEK